MARKKRIPKTKEPVTLRYKVLKDGSKSLYLDIYHDGVRKYEFLKLYLIPERTPFDKMTNDTTLRAANARKAERTRQLITDRAGIQDIYSKVLLTDWFEKCINDSYKESLQRGHVTGNTGNALRNGYNHLKIYMKEKYGNKAITLTDVDKSFCKGFAEYLNTAKSRNFHKPGDHYLAPESRSRYYKHLVTILNRAVKEDLISSNPASKIDISDIIPSTKRERVYLTKDELIKLASTPYTNEMNCKAFLFSCMCGLRWSDIDALTWGNIRKDGISYEVDARMIKTLNIIHLPLSKEALQFLPERGDKKDTDKVFELSNIGNCELGIRKWVKAAGITNKHITFHCARHTFATLMLTLGADLYTTSKLLGHTNIQTTQIYAKIVDEKKTQAVNLTNGLFEQKNND